MRDVMTTQRSIPFYFMDIQESFTTIHMQKDNGHGFAITII